MVSPYNPTLGRRWGLAAIVMAVAFGSYFGWRHFANGTGTSDDSTSRGGQTSVPIPVTLAQAQTADFKVYLNGLGTVQPYETVTVRSRVDG